MFDMILVRVGDEDNIHVGRRTDFFRVCGDGWYGCWDLLGTVVAGLAGDVAEVRDLVAMGEKVEGGDMDDLGDFAAADDADSKDTSLWARTRSFGSSDAANRG